MSDQDLRGLRKYEAKTLKASLNPRYCFPDADFYVVVWLWTIPRSSCDKGKVFCIGTLEDSGNSKRQKLDQSDQQAASWYSQ